MSRNREVEKLQSKGPQKRHSLGNETEEEQIFDMPSPKAFDESLANDSGVEKDASLDNGNVTKKSRLSLGCIGDLYENDNINCGMFAVVSREYSPPNSFADQKTDYLKLTMADGNGDMFFFTLNGANAVRFKDLEPGAVLTMNLFSWNKAVKTINQMNYNLKNSKMNNFVIPGLFPDYTARINGNTEVVQEKDCTLGEPYRIDRKIIFSLDKVLIHNTDFTLKLVQVDDFKAKSLTFITSDNNRVKIAIWDQPLKEKFENLLLETVYRIEWAQKNSTDPTSFGEAFFTARERTTITPVETARSQSNPLRFQNFHVDKINKRFSTEVMVVKMLPGKKCFVTDGTIENKALQQVLVHSYTGDTTPGTAVTMTYQLAKNGKHFVLHCIHTELKRNRTIPLELLHLPTVNI